MQMVKKSLKNEKGLTLIELLAVVVVLGIIAAIAVPSVFATIEKSKKNADKATWLVIKDAGLRWALDENVNNGERLDVDDLVDRGYLNDAPQVQSDRINDFSYIQINKTSHKYDVVVYDGGDAATGGGTAITDATFN